MKRREFLNRAAGAAGALVAAPAILAAAEAAPTSEIQLMKFGGTVTVSNPGLAAAFRATRIETVFPFFWNEEVIDSLLTPPIFGEVVMEDVHR